MCPPMRPPAAADLVGTSRWSTFAGVMLGLAGLVNAFWAVAAIVSESDFHPDRVLFGDLTMWAWILLAIAGYQAVIALLIFDRRRVGATLGIVAALASALAQVLVFGAYPVASAVVLLADALVVYALAVHGVQRAPN
jgi:uncharacterized membrane protein YuzA (DUF378 family)